MFIHREIGLKKTIDQNKFSIQCSSYCWQTRKESKYSYCQSSTWEVLKTEHWQPQTLLSTGTLLPQQEGQCREELRAAANSRAGKMSNSLQQTYSTALWPSALERPPAPTLLLASWVAFYNLAVAVSPRLHLCSGSQHGFNQPSRPAVPALPLSPYGPSELVQPAARMQQSEDLSWNSGNIQQYSAIS